MAVFINRSLFSFVSMLAKWPVHIYQDKNKGTKRQCVNPSDAARQGQTFKKEAGL